MKNTTILLGIIILFVGVVGLILGMYIMTNKSKEENNYQYNTPENVQPLDITPTNKSCQYEGKVYASGEGFSDKDGCNSCSCENGQVACTVMICE